MSPEEDAVEALERSRNQMLDFPLYTLAAEEHILRVGEIYSEVIEFVKEKYNLKKEVSK